MSAVLDLMVLVCGEEERAFLAPSGNGKEVTVDILMVMLIGKGFQHLCGKEGGESVTTRFREAKMEKIFLFLAK